MRGAYDANACVRYGALMHGLCALGVRLNFVTNEAWNRYCDYWASADFKARSEKASLNRKSEKDGPGTGHSKHTGSSRSFRTHGEILALDYDDVTPNDVFFHVYTKDHDGVTFIDNRSAWFHAELVRRREEHTQATPDQPIYEMRYEDPGASMARELMVRSLMQSFKGSQFEAFVQSHLGMHMDFGVSTSQAPPPLPPSPQEHLQQVGMDPAHSPEQQHDDDVRDIQE
ncbi:hypothetical protein Scep_002351 [Stephania cephalantha]|uniref:Uncharacterized protein n=1 Tax=Stephania cephalantha TaxID=152367 RepID=A0AAP0LCJ7_9MAGN